MELTALTRESLHQVLLANSNFILGTSLPLGAKPGLERALPRGYEIRVHSLYGANNSAEDATLSTQSGANVVLALFQDALVSCQRSTNKMHCYRNGNRTLKSNSVLPEC